MLFCGPVDFEGGGQLSPCEIPHMRPVSDWPSFLSCSVGCLAQVFLCTRRSRSGVVAVM